MCWKALVYSVDMKKRETRREDVRRGELIIRLKRCPDKAVTCSWARRLHVASHSSALRSQQAEPCHSYLHFSSPTAGDAEVFIDLDNAAESLSQVYIFCALVAGLDVA